MDIMQVAAQLLSDKLGLNVDSDTITSALSSLLGDGKGGIDLASLTSNMATNRDLWGVGQQF